MPAKDITERHYRLTNDLVGHNDGFLSLTLTVDHTVEHDHNVAVCPGRVCHIIIARVYSPQVVQARSWLVVYRMYVNTDRDGWKTREYGAFNFARSMDEAHQMSDDLIGYAMKERDYHAQQLELGLGGLT